MSGWGGGDGGQRGAGVCCVAPDLELLPDAARPVIKVCGSDEGQQQLHSLPPHTRLEGTDAGSCRLLHRLLRPPRDDHRLRHSFCCCGHGLQPMGSASAAARCCCHPWRCRWRRCTVPSLFAAERQGMCLCSDRDHCGAVWEAVAGRQRRFTQMQVNESISDQGRTTFTVQEERLLQ
jgi:hypothetical protein